MRSPKTNHSLLSFSERQQALQVTSRYTLLLKMNTFPRGGLQNPEPAVPVKFTHTKKVKQRVSIACDFSKGERIKGRSLRRCLWMSGALALFCVDPSPLFKGVWCVCGCSCVSLCGRGSNTQSYVLLIFLYPGLARFISTVYKMVHKNIKDFALTLMFSRWQPWK